MKYYLAREGVAFGPYSEFQVREAIRLGIFDKHDLALADNGHEWLEAVQLLSALPDGFAGQKTDASCQTLRVDRPLASAGDPQPTPLRVPADRPFRKDAILAFVSLLLVTACVYGWLHENRKSPRQIPARASVRQKQPATSAPPAVTAVTALGVSALAVQAVMPDSAVMPVANPAPSIAPPTAISADTVSLHAVVPPTRQIEGRIFVSSRDGLNYQPSFVEVRLYPLALLKPYLEKRNSEGSAKFEELKSQIEAAEAEKERLRLASDAAFEACARADPGSADRRALEQARVDTKKAREKATNEYYKLMQQREAVLSGEFYLEDLPKPERSTHTDDNGKFTFEVPEDGEFAVVASAEHDMAQTAEHYYWFVPVSVEGGPNKTVLLSNNNLSSHGSADSLILTVD